jgi:hypothetical protein
MSCGGERKCTYVVDAARIGDPVPGCGKAFRLEYECAPGGSPVTVEIPGEAGMGTAVELSCQAEADGKPAVAADWTGIRVLSATYGGNCGARIGNASAPISRACGGKAACDYTVDVKTLGDPAPGCGKGYFVKYHCGGEAAPRTAGVPGEAGLGSTVRLQCP